MCYPFDHYKQILPTLTRSIDAGQNLQSLRSHYASALQEYTNASVSMLIVISYPKGEDSCIVYKYD